MEYKTQELIPGQVYVTEFPDGVRVASAHGLVFCVARKTRKEAVEATTKLLNDFIAWTDANAPKIRTVKLTKSEPFPLVNPPVWHFSPQEVVKVTLAA